MDRVKTYLAKIEASDVNERKTWALHPRYVHVINTRAYQILEEAKKAIYGTSLRSGDPEWMRDLIASLPELKLYLDSDARLRYESRDHWMREYYEKAPEVILYGKCVKAWTEKYGNENSGTDDRGADREFARSNDRDHFTGRHNEGVLPRETFGYGGGIGCQ